MSKDEQLAAFRAYKFETDEGYQRYMTSVELPAVNVEQALLKVKAKWYKREKDNAFNPEWVTTSGARPTPSSTPPPAPTPPPTYTNTGGRQAPGSSAPPRPYAGNGPLAPPPVPQYGGKPLDQTYILVSNLGLLVLAVMFATPFLVGRGLSRSAYGWFLMLLMVTSIHKLILRQGRPALNLQALMVWFPAAMTSNEGLSLAMGFMMRSQPPMFLVLAAPVVAAVYDLGEYAQTHCAQLPLWTRFGAALHRKVLASRRDVLLASAASEVAIGFMLIIQLLSPSRNVMLMFLYWHLLKARYMSKDAGPMHRAVWNLIGQKARPLVAKVGLLQKTLGFVERWFTGQM